MDISILSKILEKSTWTEEALTKRFSQTNYYVYINQKTGSDNNIGTKSFPLKTLKKALELYSCYHNNLLFEFCGEYNKNEPAWEEEITVRNFTCIGMHLTNKTTIKNSSETHPIRITFPDKTTFYNCHLNVGTNITFNIETQLYVDGGAHAFNSVTFEGESFESNGGSLFFGKCIFNSGRNYTLEKREKISNVEIYSSEADSNPPQIKITSGSVACFSNCTFNGLPEEYYNNKRADGYKYTSAELTNLKNNGTKIGIIINSSTARFINGLAAKGKFKSFIKSYYSDILLADAIAPTSFTASSYISQSQIYATNNSYNILFKNTNSKVLSSFYGEHKKLS